MKYFQYYEIFSVKHYFMKYFQAAEERKRALEREQLEQLAGRERRAEEVRRAKRGGAAHCGEGEQ